jgi:hypothetical protein
MGDGEGEASLRYQIFINTYTFIIALKMTLKKTFYKIRKIFGFFGRARRGPIPGTKNLEFIFIYIYYCLQNDFENDFLQPEIKI